MPTYLYECKNGHTFEKVQKITEDPIEECEVYYMGVSGGPTTGWYERPTHKCNAKVKRLINNEGGFVLRGGGWTQKFY